MDHRGKSNPNYRHGGYIPYLMSVEEGDKYRRKFEEYARQYPRLLEPACRDILRRSIIMEIRIQRLDDYIEDEARPMAERAAAMKLQDLLIKTWVKLLTRLGLTYTPTQYIHKERRERVLSPDELLALRGTRLKKKPKEKVEAV